MIKHRKLNAKRTMVLTACALVFLMSVPGTVPVRKMTEPERVPDAVSSSVNGRDCSLTVTANSDRIVDKNAFAEKVIMMCRENSFRSLRLSTDRSGWPENLYIRVYLHRNDIGKREPEMKILYEPLEKGAGHNIREDREKYNLTIKTD